MDWDPDPLFRKGGSEDPDPLFPNVDPRIRIGVHVKMRWIRNAVKVTCLEINMFFLYFRFRNPNYSAFVKVLTNAQSNYNPNTKVRCIKNKYLLGAIGYRKDIGALRDK